MREIKINLINITEDYVVYRQSCTDPFQNLSGMQSSSHPFRSAKLRQALVPVQPLQKPKSFHFTYFATLLNDASRSTNHRDYEKSGEVWVAKVRAGIRYNGMPRTRTTETAKQRTHTESISLSP